MRKLYISPVLSILTVSAFAKSVNVQQAEKFARQYFGANTVNSVKNLKTTQASKNGSAAYYIFNNPGGGWVIVAGDDRVTPVLAHNDTGSFIVEGMPLNLTYWMQSLEKAVISVMESDAPQSPKVKKAWAQAGNGAPLASGKKTIETAKWNQGSPYNAACSAACGETVYTGCVATAMAIILRYYQWPETGRGTIPSFSTRTKGYTIAPINIDGYSYNWDIPLTDGASGNWTAAQKQAVSELIFHCGAMVEMDYSSEGSGTYSHMVVPALQEYMSYSKEMSIKEREYYTLEQWSDMLRAEIDADRPVLYSATGSRGGHEFVCDGYDKAADEFHFNWGWGGSNNGFYTIDLNDRDFADNQNALFGLKPAVSEDKDWSCDIRLGRFNVTSGSLLGDGITLDSGETCPGQDFSVKAGCLANYSPVSYEGYVKVALVSSDGTLKEYISNERSISLGSIHTEGSISIITMACRINGTVGFGDRVVMYFKDTSTGIWHPVGVMEESYEFTGYLPVYDVTYILDHDYYDVGDWYYFTLSRGRKKIESVDWFLDGISCSVIPKASVRLTAAGVHIVKASILYSDGTKEILTKNITVK